ncbi:hypothetical protein P8452_28837 [Trifolium repens]|nr:hypothetical protein P8452_28837 [Trifolium repens]
MLIKDGKGGNPLLGFTDAERQLSTEETDQVERSEKKVKRKAPDYTGDSSMPVSYADIYEQAGDVRGEDNRQSYKQSLLGGDDANQHADTV